jgi:hypothetical protein
MVKAGADMTGIERYRSEKLDIFLYFEQRVKNAVCRKYVNPGTQDKTSPFSLPDFGVTLP